MRPTLALAAAAFASAIPLLSLRAQAVNATLVGERVRITTPTERGKFRHLGEVTAVRDDTVMLRSAEFPAGRPIAVGRITKLEISRGRRSLTRRGMAFGFVLGAAAGAVYGAATHERGRCLQRSLLGCGDYQEPKGLGPAVDGFIGGVAGMAVGGILGHRVRRERWIERPLGTAARVGVTRLAGGTGVRARLAFR